MDLYANKLVDLALFDEFGAPEMGSYLFLKKAECRV